MRPSSTRAVALAEVGTATSGRGAKALSLAGSIAVDDFVQAADIHAKTTIPM
jgi:hypothetical protein